MHWFKEGDRNTNFFHSHVKGKRKGLWIQNIEDKQDNVLNSDQKIGEKAVRIFQNQFKQDSQQQKFEYINCIPRIRTEKDRINMERWPDEAEIRVVVFDLNKIVQVELMGSQVYFFRTVLWG